MRSIESEGDSIDDAIDNALRALQLGRDRVEIEILENASRGLLGFGGRKARVRATVRAPLTGTLIDDGGARTADGNDRPGVSGETTVAEEEARHHSRDYAFESGTDVRPEAITKRLATDFEARAKVFLAELLARLGVSSNIEVRAADDPAAITLDVVGDSSGLLIGRRGQTLDALEYLVNRIMSRGDDTRATRIVLDVEGYRERRRTSLEALANRLAEKAKQSGRPVMLNPLSPRDRRIVHLALQGDASVSTRSQGEGYYRKLLIVPAERSRRPPRPSDPAV